MRKLDPLTQYVSALIVPVLEVVVTDVPLAEYVPVSVCCVPTAPSKQWQPVVVVEQAALEKMLVCPASPAWN